MTHVKKNHMTRRGLELKTYHKLREYSYHLAIRPHGKPSNSIHSGVVVLLPRSVVFPVGKMWIQMPMRGFNFVTY